MPLVKIEARRGLSAETKRQLLAGVHDALVSQFGIPDHDRAQRFVEYAPEDFEIPGGRGPLFTIVTIAAFAGRSLSSKRGLYQDIVRRFEELGIPKTDVFIVLQEIPRDNWGLRGGIPASELELGFKVDV